MSEAFLEQEKIIETKNVLEDEKIETIGDTIGDMSDKNMENKNIIRNGIENINKTPEKKTEEISAEEAEHEIGNIGDNESEKETDSIPEITSQQETANLIDVESKQETANLIDVESKEETENEKSSSKQDLEVPDEEVENKDDPGTHKKDEWMDILGSGAIMKKLIKEGDLDTKPQRNEKCTISYTCTLEDGTIVDSANNFEFYLSESDVVSGLDVSIGLMTLNERCILKIEPRLAFGKKGLPPKVPGNSVVTYDVELTAIGPEEDIEFLTIEQRKVIGNKKRERGNWWYTRGDNNIAIQCYRRALDYLDEVERNTYGQAAEENQKVTDADLQALLEDRISVCNNMAAAQIKMENFDAALNSLQTVLRCQPMNLKAHFRKAKAYIGKNDLDTAMKCLQKAKEIAPDDVEIQKEINAVSQKLEKQKVSERELARRMFNGPKKDTSKNDDSEKSDNSKLGIWATVGAVVAVGVAGLVAYRFKYL